MIDVKCVTASSVKLMREIRMTPEITEILEERDAMWFTQCQQIKKLKQLLLLVDPDVSNMVMTELVMTQWKSYIKEFPSEDNNE